LWKVTKISFSVVPNAIEETLPEKLPPEIVLQTGPAVFALSTINTFPFLVPINNFVDVVVNGDTFKTVASVSNKTFFKTNLSTEVDKLLNLPIAPNLVDELSVAKFVYKISKLSSKSAGFIKLPE